MARRHGSGGRRPTEWFGVFQDETLSTTAATARFFTELNMQEKGPFTVLRMICNWSIQGTLTTESMSLMALAVRKVTLDRQSDTVAAIGGTILEADYFGSDEILFMTQEFVGGLFSQVDPSSGANEVTMRNGASGIWDIKAKRKLDSANETLVVDTEAIGVGSTDNLRLRACWRILIQPH